MAIRYVNRFTSTIEIPDVRARSIKLMLFPFSLAQAWDRFNDLLRACPHHGFSELHQLDTFYNALNANDQDSLNSAAGGNFLDKMPRECLKIIESKSKVRNSRNKAVVAKVSLNSSTPGISPDVAALTTEVFELKSMMKTMLIDKQKPSSPCHYKRNMQNQGQGSLPSNTVTNPKEDLKGITTRSGVAYQGPTIPTSSPKVVERRTKGWDECVAIGDLPGKPNLMPFSVFSDMIACGILLPVWDPIVSILSSDFSPFVDSDFLLLEEADAFLALADDPTSPEVDESYYDPEGHSYSRSTP
ncbi:hypothetical protein Tco_1404208 [Tanacetum coccineum]